MKILVIVAHPDDEILGCGGTLLRHLKQGDTIHICIVTIASNPEWDDIYRAEKIEEQKQVDILLGITTKRINLGYSVLELNTIDRGRFNHSFYRVIKEVRPDVIYTHYYNDLNDQHILVGLGAVIGARIPFSQCKILMFESEGNRSCLNSFSPNYYVDIEEFIDLKCKVFECYKSEVKEPPHPRSIEGIRTLAKFRGDEVGLKYAEAFYLIREVIK